MTAISREVIGLAWTMATLLSIYGALLWYLLGGRQ